MGGFAFMLFLIFMSRSASALVIIFLTPLIVFLALKLDGAKRLIAIVATIVGAFILCWLWERCWMRWAVMRP